MRSLPPLAVDCGARHVSVGRLTGAAAGPVALAEFASAELPAHEPDDAGWVRAVAAAVAGLGRQLRVGGPCAVGLPGHVTLHRTVRLPRVAGRARRRILTFEAGQCLPGGAGDLRWCVHPVGADADGERVVITAARAATLEALGVELRRAGFPPVAMLPAWLVWHEGFRCRQRPRANGLVVSIGARSTELVLGDEIGFFARTLALGGESVTQAIAEHLQVDAERAELIKRRGGAVESEPSADGPESMAVQLAVDQFRRRLDGELLRSLAGIGPGGDPQRPKVLYLAGGGSLLRDLPRALESSLGLRVERWTGPAQPGAVGGAVTAEAWHRTELLFLGECLAHGGRDGAGLLPPGARRAAILRRWLPAFGMAALLVVAAPLLGAQHARAAARKLGDENAAWGAKIRARQLVCDRLRAARAHLNEVNERVGALQRVAAARSSWVRLAAELQGHLVAIGDAWLERMQPLAVVPARPGRHPGGTKTVTRGPVARTLGAGGRYRITVCLFDPEHPATPPGEGAYQRARALLRNLRGSPLVAGVSEERFDAGEPGILRLEVTLETAPSLWL